MVALHHSFWKGNWVAMARTEKNITTGRMCRSFMSEKDFFF